MNSIKLEVHICDQRRSYAVTFEGPQAENMALAFMAARRATHVVSEWMDYDEVDRYDEDGEFRGMTQVPSEGQPHLIDGIAYPRLYAALNPTCEHGMSAWLCYGPAHYASDAEIAMGW